ncbi:uncharacterized protein FIBRA_05168 [Fibroporia radiculosa]|uniref:Ornithine cyclodeaminase n=1 Tax=Fibroporia radiculosa TaxID=599839 RepID=J4H3C8_9APHY|nr:uncharacterized protein FIBRA_05168 [Fibroporia radiculosa]CCM03049.1 predicted protein [Fibroporia radiculosa]
MSVIILSATNVSTISRSFGPDELTSLMSRVFYSLSQSPSGSSAEIQQPSRISISTSNHTALFMPSRISLMGTAIKVVSVPTLSAPQDVRENGLPASTLVLDERTGAVKALVNARHLTALRNAAGSLLATRLLVPPSTPPRTLLAIGAGAQVSAHVSLFLRYFRTIISCTILNRARNSRLLNLVSALEKEYPLVCFDTGTLLGQPEDTEAHLQSAIEQADIIVTATSSTRSLFPSAYVRPGTHLCLIGSYTPNMHEIDSELVRRAGKIVVDSRDACMTEAGELISAGLGPSDLIELGELVQFEGSLADDAPWLPRDALIQQVRDSGDITIFKSVGVGLQDVAIASAVVARAEKDRIGLIASEYDTGGD